MGLQELALPAEALRCHLGFTALHGVQLAKTKGIRNLELANSIVQRTLEILDYFDPDIYFIENLQTGLLKLQLFMQELQYEDLDYCMYGMPYRKRTRLWNNCISFLPKLCKWDCDALDETGKRHREAAQQGVTKHATQRHKIRELYVIPTDLATYVIKTVLEDLT